MSAATVSVVIVSHHRPADLRRCLSALRHQFYHDFEVIVVCDAVSADMLAGVPDPGTMTVLRFEEPNISRARNLGITHASGDLIAFIDDDAVAEPTWLARLVAPFDDQTVGAAGGYVRGRNGISYQWRAEYIAADGSPASFDPDGTYISRPQHDPPLKTHGTNAMFRAKMLRDLGGFDESFHFYMDETDLNMRIWTAGVASAVVPDAQVHHYFSASARRRADRTPTHLQQVGASYAYFCKKHALDVACLDIFKSAQKIRLHRLMVRGDLEPRQVRRLSRQLDVGLSQGAERVAQYATFTDRDRRFIRFQGARRIGPHEAVHCTWARRRVGHQQAASRASQGALVTLFVLSVTALFHRRSFEQAGYWVQSGGLFGKSDRRDKILCFYTARFRIRRELDEIERYRSQK